MQQVDQQVVATIIAAVVLLLAIAIIMLLLAVYYTNTKKRLTKEKEMLKVSYEQAILQSKLEIQEQTFHNVSEEIHDNIGQVLSFVKLNLGMTSGLSADQKDEKIEESRDLVAQAINDLRDLSKSLNKDNFANKGFIKAIQTEVGRIAKSGLVKITLIIDGDVVSFDGQRELVLFRILQESINNSLKHSGAGNLKINLQYSTGLFSLTLSDDGSGFDLEVAENKNGSGLKNIRNRANLIGAGVEIKSAVGQGSEIRLSLNPFEQHSYADRGNTSSPGR